MEEAIQNVWPCKTERLSGPQEASELAIRLEMVRRLGEPAALRGEGGYYLTVFCSAMAAVPRLAGPED